MASSFEAYIDESGDEGFTFRENQGGSTRWFVLSAVVFRRSNSIAPVQALKRAREALGRPHTFALHFSKLKHEHRVAYLAEVAKERMLTVSVMIYKPGIGDPERFTSGRYLLYKYACRLLIERLSWLCAQHRKPDDGDGCIELTFSDRAAMSYESLSAYLQMLRERAPNDDTITIDWKAIDPERVHARAHSQLAGLQVADAVASSVFFALNLNQFDQVEPRYIEMLKPTIFRGDRARRIGYGLKFWPSLPALVAEVPHVATLRDW